MVVDTTRLMHSTFQCCRHALPGTAIILPLLAETLQIIKQQRTLLIEVDESWVQANKFQSSIVTPDTTPKRDGSLSAANQKLFAVIDIATHDLQGLWASNAKYAVRDLGYALHNFPEFLWTPEQFQPKFFLSSFRSVAHHWNELSLELRAALCEIQGFTLEEATELINSGGFTINRWRPAPNT